MNLQPTIENIVDFIDSIEEKRNEMDTKEWMKYAKTDKMVQRWKHFLAHDPYTRWGLIKPRGYAGDATLMDFAYDHQEVQHHLDLTGETGRQINEITVSAPQSASARQRIDFITSEIENLAKSKASKVKIATFASGHGREYEKLSPLAKSRIERVIAIDQDAQSLEEFKQSCRNLSVTSVQENVFHLRAEPSYRSDLVYSLGLFDYLHDKPATRILDKMLEFMKPGGRLIVANLTEQARNIAYCEAVMDWWMITRSIEDMSLLARHVESNSDLTTKIHTLGCFHYLVAESR